MRCSLAPTVCSSESAICSGVSRRTIGRMADADCAATLRDPQALEGARTCLADTASRGSTAEEREAAVAWLQQAARNEHQVAGVQALRRRPPGPRPGAGRRPVRHGTNGNGRATATTPPPCPASAASLPQVEALRRQQQRILHRSALIDYVLTPETRGGWTADDGGGAHRAAGRHHRGGPHDRDPAGRPARLTVSRVRAGMSDGTRRPPGVRVQLRSTEYVRAAADEYPGARPAVAHRTPEHVAEVGFLNVADDEA